MDLSSLQAEAYRSVLTDKCLEGNGTADELESPLQEGGGGEGQSLKVVRTDIYLCVFAGFMTGMFAPISVLATKGDGSVDNPYVLMFFFQIGQLLTVPVMIFYYSHLFASGTRNDMPSSIWQCVEALFELPARDVRYGCCAGLAVGLGFFLFFTGSDVLPSTISVGISNCAPLVTILIDVFVLGHLDRATVWQTRFMFLSAILFLAAIVQMVFAQSV